MEDGGWLALVAAECQLQIVGKYRSASPGRGFTLTGGVPQAHCDPRTPTTSQRVALRSLARDPSSATARRSSPPPSAIANSPSGESTHCLGSRPVALETGKRDRATVAKKDVGEKHVATRADVLSDDAHRLGCVSEHVAELTERGP